MTTKPDAKDEDKQPEAELTDEQLDGVAGGVLVKRAAHGDAAPDQAVTMTAIAMAESGGKGGG